MKIFRKPAIIVKTKKGKRYLQIRTVQNELVHIGPTSNKEVWQVAFAALWDEYESLFLEEQMSFYPYMIAENIMVHGSSIGRHGEKWKAYIEKMNKKYEEHEQWLRETEEQFNCKMLRSTAEKNWRDLT